MKDAICRCCAVNHTPYSNEGADNVARDWAFSSAYYWLDECDFCGTDDQCCSPSDWGISENSKPYTKEASGE